MEEKSMIEIKRDEIGIIPENAEELILGAIKNIVKQTDMSNFENRKELDILVRDNKELINILSNVAFFSLVRKIANECGDFHTREYLINKYKTELKDLVLTADSIVNSDGYLMTVNRTIDKYFNIKQLISNYENYLDVLLTERDRLEEVADDLEDEDKYDEADKYSERADKLEEGTNNIDEFSCDPYNYHEQEIDKCKENLQGYILYNADLYVNSNELFDRLVKELDGVSLDAKKMYLSVIMEYAKKYQAKYRSNDIEQTNEESLENGKRVK